FEDNFLWQATRGDIVPMYCAWYVLANINLGFMRPMTPTGITTDTSRQRRFWALYGDQGPQYSGLTEDGRQNGVRFAFNEFQSSHKFGEGFFRTDYALPMQTEGLGTLAEIFKQRDEFGL